MIVAARKHRRPRLPAPSQCILCTDRSDFSLAYKPADSKRLVLYGLCCQCHTRADVFTRVERSIKAILASAKEGRHHG